jgi:hypothetical protein
MIVKKRMGLVGGTITEDASQKPEPKPMQEPELKPKPKTKPSYGRKRKISQRRNAK